MWEIRREASAGRLHILPRAQPTGLRAPSPPSFLPPPPLSFLSQFNFETYQTTALFPQTMAGNKLQWQGSPNGAQYLLSPFMALMSCSRMYRPGAVASGSASAGLCLPLLVESSCVVFRESSNLPRSTSLMSVCVCPPWVSC